MNPYHPAGRVTSSPSAESRGISLSAAVFVVFLVLKLAGIGQVASWSWWWVASPLWIPLAFVLSLMALILGVTAVAALVFALLGWWL